MCEGGTNGSVIPVVEAPVSNGFRGMIALISDWRLWFGVARRLFVVMFFGVDHLFEVGGDPVYHPLFDSIDCFG